MQSKTLFCIALLCCCWLVLVAFAIDSDPSARRQQTKRIRTTLQACKNDFRSLCFNTEPPLAEGGVAPRSRSFPFQCLRRNVELITDSVCQAWVTAEAACREATFEAGKCRTNMDPRLCFASVNATDLPKECTQTEFFKAQAFPRRRLLNTLPKSQKSQ